MHTFVWNIIVLLVQTMESIEKYFPGMDENLRQTMASLLLLYTEWNSRINVISRKDMDNFYINHVLHSLAITKVITFAPGTRILDVGTGGGFPGIPLAIMFPQCQFVLVDSIEKKIKVVREVVSALELKNVVPLRERAENVSGEFDFVVSRAVTALPAFVKWVDKKISRKRKNVLPNGIFYLKGGDFQEELQSLAMKYRIYDISTFFDEPFFETKKVVHLYR